MKLMKFVQEGVFDKVKAEPPVKMQLKDLTASNVRDLSDEALGEYKEYLYPRRNRIWKSMSELDKKMRDIKKTYHNDFATRKTKGFVKPRTDEFGSTWIRAGSEAERLIDQFEGDHEVYSEKYNLYASLGKIFSDEDRRRKNQRKKEGRARAAGDWPEYQQQNPKNTPSSIPPKVQRASGLKSSLTNPYFGRKGRPLEKQYAGHPAHYPYWSNDWKRRIMAMDELLTKNGKQGFSMMYAGTFYNSGNRFNFMIIGANGNFLWRKYDPSPGAGQNHVYLNGKMEKTTTVEHWMSAEPKLADSKIQAL